MHAYMLGMGCTHTEWGQGHGALSHPRVDVAYLRKLALDLHPDLSISVGIGALSQLSDCPVQALERGLNLPGQGVSLGLIVVVRVKRYEQGFGMIPEATPWINSGH